MILIVAITVATAATAYIWAGGLGDTREGPEDASATAKTVSLNGDNDAEWIKITLTAEANAPSDDTSLDIEIASSW